MTAIDILKLKRETPKKSATEYSDEQAQTESTFAYKWKKREFYENEDIKKLQIAWLFERYCGGNPDMLKEWLKGGKKIILDAGCGSGYSAMLFFNELLKDNYYLGVDISSAVEVGVERFAEANLPGDFLQLSLMDMPIPENSVDMIFAEGVLHHTDSTEKALIYLSTKLKKGGRFLFYVYVKKAPIREFTDDHIRHQLAKMSNEEAWDALMPLTKFGKMLDELKIEIDIPEDIPVLGIKKGKTDLQRFFYWNICKMWVRPEANLDEMNIINFDWFMPLNCQRHTKEEVMEYCKNAGLEIERMDVMESGITVVAKKI